METLINFQDIYYKVLRYDLGDSRHKALFITADHTGSIIIVYWIRQLNGISKGGEVLLIDEVHKYPNWSRELKNIFDGIPHMRVVFSASSALDIYRGQVRDTASYIVAADDMETGFGTKIPLWLFGFLY